MGGQGATQACPIRPAPSPPSPDYVAAGSSAMRCELHGRKGGGGFRSPRSFVDFYRAPPPPSSSSQCLVLTKLPFADCTKLTHKYLFKRSLSPTGRTAWPGPLDYGAPVDSDLDWGTSERVICFSAETETGKEELNLARKEPPSKEYFKILGGDGPPP